MFSILFAMSALWARIGFDSSIVPIKLRPVFASVRARWAKTGQKKPPNKEEFNHPMIFFSYITRAYQTDEKNLEIKGSKYEQIIKYKSYEEFLKSMAVEITILAKRIG